MEHLIFLAGACWIAQFIIGLGSRHEFNKIEFLAMLFIPVLPCLYFLVKVIIEKMQE